MKVKKELLLQVLKERAMTCGDLARETGISAGEIERLLSGEAVDEPTARRFIYYFGADEAQGLIDWEAIGKKNPLADDNGGKRGGGETKKGAKTE